MKGFRHPGNGRLGKVASTAALGRHKHDGAKATRQLKKRSARRRNRQQARNNLR